MKGRTRPAGGTNMDNGASSYRRYLDGDNSAFDEIIKEYFDSLVFFLNRYLRDLPAAEDIAMDAFADLIVSRHRYDFRVSLKTYLFMLGRSRALNYLKHRKILPMTDLEEAGEQPAQQETLEEMLLADERKRRVSGALAQLPTDLREAVYLVYFEELSCDEAAKVMKKNRKQVYNLLYRAKNKLRTVLGEEGERLL